MRRFIVITSIFEPTEAVIDFSRQKDYKLVVVGDKKTPSGWQSDNVTYLSIEQQKYLGYELSRLLPYNHYCRKMLGYMKDFESEIPMYLHSEEITELISAGISANRSIDENLYAAYSELNKAKIVCKKEMECLEAWLNDCKKIEMIMK